MRGIMRIVMIIMTRLSSLEMVYGVVVETGCLLVTRSFKVTGMLASLNQRLFCDHCLVALVTWTKNKNSTGPVMSLFQFFLWLALHRHKQLIKKDQPFGMLEMFYIVI